MPNPIETLKRIELKNNPNFEYITMSSGDEKNDSNIKKATTVDTKSESAFKVSNVNINTATQTELETLPGIGPSLALKIINYRKENGKYQLNLWMANKIIFLEAGIPEENISMPNLCTCCNPEFLFSHRASHGKRGNLGAFLGIRS